MKALTKLSEIGLDGLTPDLECILAIQSEEQGDVELGRATGKAITDYLKEQDDYDILESNPEYSDEEFLDELNQESNFDDNCYPRYWVYMI